MWYLYLNFQRIFSYLKTRSAYEGYRVRWVLDNFSSGEASPERQEITVNRVRLSKPEQLFVLAHELGHVLDDRHHQIDWNLVEQMSLRFYRQGWSGGLSPALKQKLLAREQAAWQIAEQLLNQAGGFRWYRRQFQEFKTSALASYESIPET